MIPLITRELLDRYDRPGPRYTSYPTVPAWTDSFGETEYCRGLADLARRPGRDISVYVHLPFCAKKCHYCGCNSVVAGGRGAVDAYIDRLEREMAIAAGAIGAARNVAQMHWGGGTPNFLTERQLRRISSLVENAFPVGAESEISVEIDPRLANRGQVSLLRELGFNRISLGVQDFASVVQKAIGRIQSEDRTRRVFEACVDAGFASVNVDLVYGLPGQTAESFAHTLRTVVDLGPDRIACFGYAHVPWVKPNQNLVDVSLMPGRYEKSAFFRMAIDAFGEAGYEWIGLDHFARPGDELALALGEKRLHRNFMGYTTRPELPALAFGMSGISDLGDCFAQNDADLDRYLAALDGERLPVVRGHRLDRDDRLRRMAILSLMCHLELPFDLTRERFGTTIDAALAPELERLRAFEEEGFVVFHDDRIEVTALGRFFLRNLCMELDAYFETGSDKPLFSRTV